MKYIVPEFYQHFTCKCGECRHSCCEGWPVRISRQEYYRLLGVKCSKRLRTKLDNTLKLCPSPSAEIYAEVSSDWRGLCRLHREDGLCELQAELGESALPEVCRRYPRSTRRLSETCYSTCSNSCEKVVEQLMDFKATMRFSELDLPLKPELTMSIMPGQYDRSHQSIVILQDRSMPLQDRFLVLAEYLTGNRVDKGNPQNLSLAFQFLNLVNQYYVSSANINEYCAASSDYFYMNDDEPCYEEKQEYITDKFRTVSEHLELIYPDWQLLFEQLLVNHMFYFSFPGSSPQESTEEALLSLIIIYAFLRFHVVSYMAERTDSAQLVDLIAALFRVISHSDFNQVTVRLIRSLHCSFQDCILQLISL